MDEEYKENFQLKKGEELTLTLDLIPTAGYDWHPVYDHDVIDIISRNLQRASDVAVGGSAKIIFKVKAINFGTTTLRIVYKRDWERIAVAEKSYLIKVTSP